MNNEEVKEFFQMKESDYQSYLRIYGYMDKKTFLDLCRFYKMYYLSTDEMIMESYDKIFSGVKSPRLYKAIKSTEEEVLQIQSDEVEYLEIQSLLTPSLNKFNENDYIIKLVEDILFSYKYYINSNKSTNSILETALLFCKLRSDKSLINKFIQSSFIKYFEENICEDVEIQSFEENIGDLRDKLQYFRDVKTSKISKDMYKCFTYLIAFEFLTPYIDIEKFGYNRLERDILKRNFLKNKDDMILVLCETLAYILEKGYQILKTGDTNIFFQNTQSYQKLHDDIQVLYRQSKLLNNPEIHGFRESTFRKNLDDVIEKLSSIKKHSSHLDTFERKLIVTNLDNLLMLRDDIQTKAACREARTAPFAVCVYGNSGIGKSMIMEILYYVYGKMRDLDTTPQSQYTLDPASDFWNGWTSSMWCIKMDDVANEKPDLKDSKTLKHVIQVINNVPFCPDQAALEDKGRTPCRAELCLASTNVKTLNAYHYFSCPSAVQRRFPYIITPVVRENFSKDGKMLDSTKVPETPLPDVWLFKVEKVITGENTKSMAKFELIGENWDLKDLLKWFVTAAKEFRECQTRMKSSVEALQKIKLCDCCKIPLEMCSKIQIQSLEIVEDVHQVVFSFMNFLPIFLLKIIIFLLLCILKIFFKSNYHYYSNKLLMRVSLCRNMFVNMGEKSTKVFTITVFASFLLAIKMYLNYKEIEKIDINGEASSKIGKEPTPEEDGKENVWYNDEYELTSMDYSRQSLSAKSEDFTSFCKRMGKNIIFITTKPNQGNKGMRSCAVCITGQTYMVNSHTFKHDCDYFTIEILQQSRKDGVNTNLVTRVYKKDIVDLGGDKSFFIIKNLPPKRDIRPYFCSPTFRTDCVGMNVLRTMEGELKYLNLDKIEFKGPTMYQTDMFGKQELDVYKCFTKDTYKRGNCGALTVAKTNLGYCILGIHVGYAPGHSYSLRVTSQDVETIKENIFTVQEGSLEFIEAHGYERPLGDLHKKSNFRYQNGGTAKVLGSFQGFRAKPKSNVKITPMAYCLAKHGYGINYGAPIMSGWEPYGIALSDLIKPIQDIDHNLYNYCIDDFLKHLDGKLDLSILHPLDDFSTINGHANVRFIDKMKRTTSAGNPYKKSKKYFMFDLEPRESAPNPVDFTEEIHDRIDLMIKNYKKGIMNHPNYCAHLKDEPVSFKKIKMKKTRVFTGSSIESCFVVRKFLLTFTKLLQSNRILFQSAPGTIAQSTEWQEIYQYITQFGKDRVVAGDYKAFDKTMSPLEIQAAFKIMRDLCERSGNYTSSELRVIDGIAQDTAFSLVDFNGDLVQFYGSNPSGNPLTVIINSLVNVLRMRYVFYKIQNDTKISFDDNVALMTYGDDNILNVNKICPWYNHTAIQEEFEKMGITYTMADKEAESVPYINIEEASFLKRYWRYDEDVGAFLCPLEEDSIEKSLMVWVESKSIANEEQCIDIVGSAVREYFYYGKDIFEEKRSLLKNMITELGYNIWVKESTFPTWEELKDQFWRNSNGE